MAKQTVEQCLTFAASDVLQHRTGRYTGMIWWLRDDEIISSIGFETDRNQQQVTLLFADDAEGKNPIRQVLALRPSRTRHNGVRWWLSCVYCNRRCGRLHLAYGEDFFACRKCLDLSYVSAQQAHAVERMCLKLGISPRGWL
jgi:hypothetical protein